MPTYHEEIIMAYRRLPSVTIGHANISEGNYHGLPPVTAGHANIAGGN